MFSAMFTIIYQVTVNYIQQSISHKVMPTSPYSKSHNKSPYVQKTIKSQPSIYKYDEQPADDHYEKMYHQAYDTTNKNMLITDEQLFMDDSHKLQTESTPSKKLNKNIALNKNSNQTPVKKITQVERNRSKSARSRIKTETSQNNMSPSIAQSIKSRYAIHHEDKLKVYVKFKPPTNHKTIKNVHYLSEKQIEIERQTNNKIYNFDHVFHHDVHSNDVFNMGCKQLIDQVVNDGNNGLVFVYGHTGTGKTFTMGLLDFVDENSNGIVPQSIRYIFDLPIQSITFSFTEIYMDEVYDMLDFQGQKKMTIRESQKNKEPYVQNLINISLNSIQQAYQLINIGLQKRRVAEQRINKRSSRGHGIITLNIFCYNKWSKICFVDLAGSQRIKQSDSTGVKLNEAVHINSSLSALETLLMNIHEKSVRMYRGNKLTRLLQPFIESGKIRLFVTSNYENIQPIQFAKRCKGIKFMQREVPEPQKPKPKLRKQASSKTTQKQSKQIKDRIEKLETMNKNLFYCLSNLLGVFLKINSHLSELIETQTIKSNFSLSDTLSIKNQTLEMKTNHKINEMEKKQQQIVEKAEFKSLQITNLQQIMGMIKAPNQFVTKVHEVGMEIFTGTKQLANLSQYRNIYKKEVFISELKTNILQNKNEQFERAINHLIKAQPSHTQHKLSKQLKDIGILIQKNNGGMQSTRKTPIKNIAGEETKKKSQNTEKSRTPMKKSRIQNENSPLNRVQHAPTIKNTRRAQIWIQQI